MSDTWKRVRWEGGEPPETFACRSCGGPLCTLWAEEMSEFTGEVLRAVKVQQACRSCGLVYAIPEDSREAI